MIRVLENPADLNLAAAALICASANENISEKGDFSIVLSGGNTPRSVYELLTSPEFKNQVGWQQVKIFFGDERYVPQDDDRSNFKMAREALLDHVPVLPQNIFPIPTGSTPEKDAAAYQSVLKNNFTGALPEFDLILLGLGENGHTASLFPFSKILNETEKFVSEVFVEEQNEFRISLTAPVINAARQIVFLVSGIKKAEVLYQIIEGEKNSERFPAQLISSGRQNITWLVDQDAASLLNPWS
jgi:6-phosphogluconolactonase